MGNSDSAKVQAAPDTKALVSDEQMMAEERMAEQLVKEAEASDIETLIFLKLSPPLIVASLLAGHQEKVEKELAANTTTTKDHL